MRMKAGKEKVGRLGERLEQVRLKVERNAEREREGRVKVGRRLRMLWGCLGFWSVGILVLVVIRHWPFAGVDVGKGSLMGLQDVRERGNSGNESFASRLELEKGQGGLVSSSESSSEQARQTVEVDPVLRLFDDL